MDSSGKENLKDGVMRSQQVFTLARSVLAHLITHGFAKTIDVSIYRMVEIWHDWRLGIMTCGHITRVELGFDNHLCHDYVPVEYSSFHNVMKSLKIQEGKDVFLDYGSGLGRAVIAAATYPFRKVIGVELSPELNAIAEENVRRAHTKLRCKEIQLITADAASYSPPRDTTVFFLFNPFRGQVLSRVLDNIRTSVADAPRDIAVVYEPPEGHRSVLDDSEWLVRCGEFRAHFGRRVILVYRNTVCGPVKLTRTEALPLGRISIVNNYPYRNPAFRLVGALIRRIPIQRKYYHAGALMKTNLLDQELFSKDTRGYSLGWAEEKDIRYMLDHRETLHPRDVFLTCLASGHLCFCAKKDGKVLAFDWLSFDFGSVSFGKEQEVTLLPLPENTVFAYDLFTYSRARRQGIGTLLKLHEFAALRSMGIHTQYCYIELSNNASLCFHLKLGAVPETLMHCYRLGRHTKAFFGTRGEARRLKAWARSLVPSRGL